MSQLSDCKLLKKDTSPYSQFEYIYMRLWSTVPERKAGGTYQWKRKC